ncbi:Oryzain alpha chain [Tritrichomonas foetus]|uniref:Oryzain alpha chain n=1 Tax=Tritrichomonas foetus TaxID=1144522 RepID=A0A1J4JQQ1_9EUKA|nr:Oryzain alpha chain [Tritrichomonas foetus]|eukprot:OHT01363.1 Oryzain alpha chain [Tritrichomonas foetus]
MIALLFYLSASSINILQHEEKAFVSWMRSTNQYYTGDEYYLRLGIYLSNKRLVQEHNSNKANTFRLTLNKFAAMTPSELKTYNGLLTTSEPQKAERIAKRKTTHNGESLDYREKGVVNEIRDQGECAACWAFAIIQSVESAYALKHTTLYELSEQNLIDCVLDCKGCQGGYIPQTYVYVMNYQDGQFNLRDDYPFLGGEEACHFEKRTKSPAQLVSYKTAITGDEDQVKEFVEQYGPVAAGLNGSQIQFYLYESGIFNIRACTPYPLSHGVGIVGYGVEGDSPYWILRNTWGKSWGEAGYCRMIRGYNMCGCAQMVSIPVLE